jgi:hypothetical protein
LEKDIRTINKIININKNFSIVIKAEDKVSKKIVEISNNVNQRLANNMRDALSNFGISMNQAAINFRNFGTALKAVNLMVART